MLKRWHEIAHRFDYVRALFEAHRSRFRTYSVTDLLNGVIVPPTDDIKGRMEADKRKPGIVCTIVRRDGPTPCWWPYCNCGLK